jgi:ATP-binding cassette subfamily B protein
MYVIGRKLARIAANAERIEADERSTIDGQVVDAVANFVSVKAFGSERREAKRLYGMRQAVIDAATHSYVRAIFFWGAMSLFVRWILWPSTFLVNIYLYSHGRIDLAQMTTFVAAIVLFTNYIWEVIWSISQLNIKLAGMEEAYRYLFGGHNVFKDVAEPQPKSPPAFTSSLEFSNVSFAYPDKADVQVLNNVSFTVKRGEKIGIVGPSGGGKSTLLKLLLGYYPLPTGELLVDGQPADNRSLTDLTAYVPQDTTIFHRSIRDNIA